MEPQTRPPTRIKALLLQGDCNIMPELPGRDLVPLQLYILTLCMLSAEERYRSLMFVTLSLPYLAYIGLHSSLLPIKLFFFVCFFITDKRRLCANARETENWEPFL